MDRATYNIWASFASYNVSLYACNLEVRVIYNIFKPLLKGHVLCSMEAH